MKLVIQTQIRENYAAHNGFTGEYYWKYKGGNAYVVPNLSSANVNRILEKGIPNLTKIVEENNDYYQEYILDWEIVGDDETPWEKWETPIILEYNKELGWVATRHTINDDEYGYMRGDIAAKTEAWVILEGNVREEGSYKCFYEMKDGSILTYDELEQKRAA
jgi:hypothetical protein